MSGEIDFPEFIEIPSTADPYDSVLVKWEDASAEQVLAARDLIQTRIDVMGEELMRAQTSWNEMDTLLELKLVGFSLRSGNPPGIQALLDKLESDRKTSRTFLRLLPPAK